MRALTTITLALLMACSSSNGSTPTASADDGRKAERKRMVDTQMRGRGVVDERVLRAMEKVPRHAFVPEERRKHAYEDRPLLLSDGQTISQPYIVALMTELAQVGPKDKVLEIGTGSGYQAAVLAELAKSVYSIEIVEALGERAARDLKANGYNVNLRIGDGYQGWPEAAPFDAIVVTAAPPAVPEPLRQQLAEGGRLVIPVGKHYQQLVVIERKGDRFEKSSIIPVRFVPMTGTAQEGK
jgi:protein-L-isoaspartate(D-aspartate) O-methyltransferase